MAAGNANAGQTVSSTAVDLFKSARAGGSQIDGCIALTVYNSGVADALVRCQGHQNSDEWGPLPIGKSVTFRVHMAPGCANAGAQIDLVQAKRAGSTDTTIGHLVTERR